MNEQNVQSVQGQGNTIPGPNGRPLVQSASNRWCFTLNNWTEEEYVQIVQSFSQGGHNYVIGKEVGENGTPHLQGYVEVKDKKEYVGRVLDYQGEYIGKNVKGIEHLMFVIVLRKMTMNILVN
jgi:hypothetical protein